MIFFPFFSMRPARPVFEPHAAREFEFETPVVHNTWNKRPYERILRIDHKQNSSVFRERAQRDSECQIYPLFYDNWIKKAETFQLDHLF